MSPLSALRSPLSAFALSLFALSGCASRCGEIVTVKTTTETTTTAPSCAPNCQPRSVSATPSNTPMEATPSKLVAVGYGAVGNYSQYTQGQQKLMAMRAAQVDAYRNLAEQVYGFRVWGTTAVSAFATQNDTIRTYVDAFVRGARVVNTTSIADGNFETTVELVLSPQFFDCVEHSNRCGIRVSAPVCATPGCTSSSANYVSN